MPCERVNADCGRGPVESNGWADTSDAWADTVAKNILLLKSNSWKNLSGGLFFSTFASCKP